MGDDFILSLLKKYLNTDHISYDNDKRVINIEWRFNEGFHNQVIECSPDDISLNSVSAICDLIKKIVYGNGYDFFNREKEEL